MASRGKWRVIRLIGPWAPGESVRSEPEDLAMSGPSPMGRWLNWKPPIFEKAPDYEPTKTTESVSDGFDGALPGQYQKIEAALAVLNRTGVRIMRIDGAAAIGIWSDLDGPGIRAALQVLQVTLPVRYLDGAGIPPPYRTRRVSGEAVSPAKLIAMESLRPAIGEGCHLAGSRGGSDH